MTNKEMDLLITDLCARVPYGTVLKVNGLGNVILESVDSYSEIGVKDYTTFLYSIEDVRPYLRPMSSMTDEEINEFIIISDTVLWLGNKRSTCILSLEQMDWLNAHHFDYRGLIEKGLALEAPEGMYKI